MFLYFPCRSYMYGGATMIEHIVVDTKEKRMTASCSTKFDSEKFGYPTQLVENKTLHETCENLVSLGFSWDLSF